MDAIDLVKAKRRRLRVSGPDIGYVLAIGAIAGVGAVIAGPSPTGGSSIDVPLVLLSTVVVVWFAASAPWWSLVGVASVAAALAPDAWWLLVALASLGLALGIGLAGWANPWRRALAAGLAIQVLCRLGQVGRFGLSAAIAIMAVLIVALLGLSRRSRRERRITYATCAALLLLSVLASLGLGLAANSARDALTRGNQQARHALSILASGDFTGAQDPLREAAASFAEANADLDRFWSKPARFVPVVAQHGRVAVELASAASTSLATIADVVGTIDLDSLEVVNGSVDIDAIKFLEPQIQLLDDTLVHLDATVGAIDSPWLVAPLRTRLTDLQGDIRKQQVRGANALEALQLAPALLGDSTKRVYLIAFTTPAEARGMGGFMGNYAELTIDDGKLSISGFGRSKDLNDFDDGTMRRVTGPPGWLARYAGFGFVQGPAGTTSGVPWSNITLSPDFPATAQVMAELYPQSGGRHVDGVIGIDVEGVAGLLALTGPISVPGLDTQLDAGNVATFLLQDQYELTNTSERADMLAQVAQVAIGRLLGGVIPGPVTIGKVLGPLIPRGHLSMWTDDPDEQNLLRRIGMLHELTTLAGRDGLLITANNASANKIDVYLDREVTYTATVDPATGLVTSTATIRLTNHAPSSGLPPYVIGNLVNLPDGTNRTYLSVFSALDLVSATLEGMPIEVATTAEGDWSVYSQFVDIPPGGDRTMVLELHGAVDPAAGYELVTRPQPLVLPEHWIIDARTTTGAMLIAFDDTLAVPTTFGSRS